MSTGDVLERHRRAGRFFEAGGTASFVREKGNGEPVVLMHGVPSSCFLYRKVIDELAERGLRGVSFDLPGMGLADRPADYDYSWTGLGAFSRDAVDALGLDEFHLVVHDIGGPIGFEVAAEMPGRIRSLTLLNTMVKVAEFHRPWVMEPFVYPVLGELWLASMIKPTFRPLMYRLAIEDRSAVPTEELDAYVDLLKRQDNGKAFLKIMRGFERTEEKQQRYIKTVRDVPYPVQIVWGENDPALKVDVNGERAREAAGLETLHRLPGRHFLQEDQAPAVAGRIARFAGGRSP